MTASEVTHGPDGWVFPLAEASVTNLGVDDRFLLRLRSGVEIVIETPFRLWRDDETFTIDPSRTADVAMARPLLHQVVRTAVATSRGILHITFEDGQDLEVAPTGDHGSWKIHFPDGCLY
jgi:hypothetical protein